VTNLALLENTYYYLGRAYGESANHTGAVAALTTLLTRFPNSGFYYDAKFALARSYRGLGKYSLVNETLGDIARRATNNVMINKASLELSKAQLADGKKKEALASLMRITMFADHANPELRPILEEAYALSFPLLKELEKREDLIDTCRQYLTKFPQGTNVALVNKFKQDAELLPVAPAP
jgi:tetratricopeptide (TPR) repeat protein